MKLLVTEMPFSMYVCPFSREYPSSIWDENMERKYKVFYYHCSVIKSTCDLENGICSGLTVLEEDEE